MTSVRDNLEAGKYYLTITKVGKGAYHKKDPNILTKDGGYVMSSKEAYYAEGEDLHRRFMEDLFKEHGVENNPKRIKCFDLAWEHGHSEGLINVIYHFEEFVELIK